MTARHKAEEPRAEDRRTDAERLGTSWTSVIFGWLAALGAGLILSGIVGAIVGAILGAGGHNNRPQRAVLRAWWDCSSPCFWPS